MIRYGFFGLFFFAALFGKPQEKPFVLIVPSYNNKDWYKLNLDSLFSQKYENFRVVYIDDASTDGTGDLVNSYIKKMKWEHKTTLIRNQERAGALANIFRAVWMCDPSDIIATVDGDDWLSHEGVLEKLNAIYADPDVWMTYGQFVEYPTNCRGGAESLPVEIIEKNAFRDYRWVTTHLRTFYARLFQKIPKEDFLYEGKFFRTTWDLAFMFPLLEMSGGHSRFIPEPIYVYNVVTPLSDNKLYKDLQRHLETVIRAKKRYTPIEEDRPYVTCDLRGGLGNQLFEIAATLAYSWDNDVISLFPDLNRQDSHISYNRDRVFFRLSSANSPRPFTHAYHEPIWHSPQKIPFQTDMKLFGYFQSWKLFDRYREKLLSVFAPSQSVLKHLEDKYASLIALPNTVAIHVRTFNSELHHSKLHPFLGLEYYKNALDLFPADATFVVFSDRINWCKVHFSSLGRNFVFIEGNDAAQDLFLMSMMKHTIISNSTFSWWGAYFNQNPEKIVVAPQWWMHPEAYDFPPAQPNDFYLNNWKVVPWNLNEPYPTDISLYDISTSLDSN